MVTRIRQERTVAKCGRYDFMRVVLLGILASLGCFFSIIAAFQQIGVPHRGHSCPNAPSSFLKSFPQRPLRPMTKYQSSEGGHAASNRKKISAARDDNSVSDALEDGGTWSGSSSDVDVDVDIDSVSEAEALLACRAYLQRRNRLGEWTMAKERKRRAKRAFPSVAQQARQRSSVSSDSAGFFWENPSQLKYLQRRSASLSLSLDDNNKTAESFVIEPVEDDVGGDSSSLDSEEDDVGVDETEDIWESFNLPNRSTPRQPLDMYSDDEEDIVLDDRDESAAFDGAPSISRVRRSAAAKRRWSDPEWKAKWYEKRWGNRKKSTTTRRRQQLEDKLRVLQPSTFLSNEAVASMTEEEITEAIQLYVSSRQKRSISRKKSLVKRRLALDESANDAGIASGKLPRDALLRSDPKRMEDLRRKRSERAMKAYQKRVENQYPVPEGSPLGKFAVASSAAVVIGDLSVDTPTGAMSRIEAHLDDGLYPVIKDVELMLKATRLARRKDVLRRILSERFSLRGRCVPESLDDLSTKSKDAGDDSGTVMSRRMMFVTQAPIQQLGSFCIAMLQNSVD